MRRGVLLLLLTASLACARHAGAPGPSGGPPAVATAEAPRAPVVVTIVVDQMAAWIADERWSELPADGGFARLVREGTRAREMRFAHAATDTAPGHAALYTGAPPRTSGIFGNEVVEERPDRDGGPPEAPTGKRVSVLADARVALVGRAGPMDGVGSSPAILRVETLADRLRTARPDAFIASISLKDRGAIFGGGHAPDASVWYDIARGEWITSTAFARALPSWAASSPFSHANDTVWTLLDAPWTRAHARTPDAQSGEGDYGGMGIAFPHAWTQSSTPNAAFRATPAADGALLGLALGALDDARARGKTTLLALSLSANDYVGHVFGPDAWESWDELRRLDAALGRFFAELDARFGDRGWAALLSADHGVTRMPEAVAATACARDASTDRWRRPCEPGVRILPDALASDLAAAAVRAIGPGRWVAGVADPYVYLSHEARALDPSRRATLMDALRRALSARPGVRAVYDVAEVAGRACPPEADDSVDALVCRAIAPAARAGELYVVTTPGSFFDPSVVVGSGTSHGSPYLFDRAVPLVVRAPGRVPAGAILDEPIGFGAFARTAASLLGINPPASASSARDLTVAP